MSHSKVVIVPDPIPYLAPSAAICRGLIKVDGRSYCPGATILPVLWRSKWIGADPRHPLHIVVLSFPQSDRPSIRLTSKAEDLVHADLQQVLVGKE